MGTNAFFALMQGDAQPASSARTNGCWPSLICGNSILATRLSFRVSISKMCVSSMMLQVLPSWLWRLTSPVSLVVSFQIEGPLVLDWRGCVPRGSALAHARPSAPYR